MRRPQTQITLHGAFFIPKLVLTFMFDLLGLKSQTGGVITYLNSFPNSIGISPFHL